MPCSRLRDKFVARRKKDDTEWTPIGSTVREAAIRLILSVLPPATLLALGAEIWHGALWLSHQIAVTALAFWHRIF